MNRRFDRSTWTRVRLGDIVQRSRKQADPLASGVERYVAGGHIDGDWITIARYGDPSDGQMGSTFRYVFEPGQILFLSARPYLRKSGVVDFSGVVADKTYVLDAVPERGLVQEFLPFVLASEPFVRYATNKATGSMNPRLLWGPFQRYEFDLPPVAEQKMLADLLWSMERHRQAVAAQIVALHGATAAHLSQRMTSVGENWKCRVLGDLAEVVGGGTPSTGVQEYWDGDVPWLTPGDLTSRDGQVIAETDRRISRAGLENSSAKLLPERTVLVTTRATIGVVGLVGRPLATNQGFQSLICGDELLPEYLMKWVQLNRHQLIARAGGSTFLEIGARALRSIPIEVPPLSEQRRVVQQVVQADRALEGCRRELDSLTALEKLVLADALGEA